jgi:hypothetical protein
MILVAQRHGDGLTHSFGRMRNIRSADSSLTTVGWRMLSIKRRPTRAYNGVTNPSHKLESLGVSTGTASIRRRRRAGARIRA